MDIREEITQALDRGHDPWSDDFYNEEQYKENMIKLFEGIFHKLLSSGLMSKKEFKETLETIY